jgi:hypothetical protein
MLLTNFGIASASHLSHSNITTLRPLLQTDKNVSYNNGNIYLNGFSGSGSIEIYSIIGNKISEISAKELSNFSFMVQLDSRTMYIIRVISINDVKTFKIITP